MKRLVASVTVNKENNKLQFSKLGGFKYTQNGALKYDDINIKYSAFIKFQDESNAFMTFNLSIGNYSYPSHSDVERTPLAPEFIKKCTNTKKEYMVEELCKQYIKQYIEHKYPDVESLRELISELNNQDISVKEFIEEASK